MSGGRSHRFASRLGAACLLFVCSLGVAAPAGADTLDKFISVYKEIEKYAPPNSLPVKSADFEASKGLFVCLKTPGNDPGVCAANFHDTPLGKKASDEAGIPEAFWRVLDAYIAYAENDYWGVAQHLGEAAVCAVVQVLLGGADACSLIKELVEMAKDLYDAGKAVVEFLKDVGETLGDVGSCIVSLGSDCGDDGPPTPDETYVYEYIFLPKIAEGVQRRELADGSYEKLVASLEGNANHKPPILSKPWPSGEDAMFGAQIFLYPHFTAKAIANARILFEKAVDVNWGKDVTQKALPALGTARHDYLAGQLTAVAKQSAQNYVNGLFPDPGASVNAICYDHFTKSLPYRHVDEWIQSHPTEAQKVKAKSNKEWCQQDFWGQKAKFAVPFHSYVKSANICPESGAGFKCQKLEKYKTCVGLMGSVYQSKQCGIDSIPIGVDIANEIAASFAGKGSKYSCAVEKGAVPVKLRCSRPTQQYHCNKIYYGAYGPGGKYPLPVKVMECALTKTAGYMALENKFWGQTIPELAKMHPSLSPFVGQKGYDPLLIVALPKIYAELEADAKKQGLAVQIVMDTEPTIDGVNVPTLGSNMGSALKEQLKTVPVADLKLTQGGVNPPDPAGKLSSKIGGSLALGSGMIGAGAAQGSPGQSKVLSGQMPPGSAPGGAAPKASLGGAAQLSAAPSAVGAPKGPDLGGVPAPAPTQGKLPASGGRAASPGTVARATGSAELRSGARVTVAGRFPSAWGQTVTVPDSAARRSANGICDVAVAHDTLNTGSASSGPFSRGWVNDRNPAPFTDTYAPLPAGGTVQKTDTLALRPGVNRLTLTIDPQYQVQETDETNNVYRLTITVTGTCGAPAAPAPSRGGGAPPPAGTRLPAGR